MGEAGVRISQLGLGMSVGQGRPFVADCLLLFLLIGGYLVLQIAVELGWLTFYAA